MTDTLSDRHTIKSVLAERGHPDMTAPNYVIGADAHLG
jgi:hypothetical protein